MEEIWKDIKNYEGLYQVSNLGRVKSLSRFIKCRNGKRKTVTKILKQTSIRYAMLDLGKRNKKIVHRLVAEAFIPNPNNKPQINHIDGNKLNNNAKNLEWCTQSENQIHAYRTGLQKGYCKSQSGENNPKNRPVIQMDMNNNFINEYFSITEAQIQIGLSHISCVCRGVRNHSGNFKWRYK